MKKFMLTTALVAATSMAATAQTADTTPGAAGADVIVAPQAMGQTINVPAFLVSDFTGKSLYTLDTEETRALRDQRGAAPGAARLQWESSATFAPDRDAWDNIGSVDDVVLSQDGEVRGVLIDVGGFLGFGARTVMVDIDELYFVTDDSNPDRPGDFFVVAAMSTEQLEALPEWDADRLAAGFDLSGGYQTGIVTDTGMSTDRGADMGSPSYTADAPAVTAPIDGASDPADHAGTHAAGDLTAENLLGADVVGAEGESIATVGDLVLADDGSVTHAIIDVGGFLGIGSHTVALEVDSVEVVQDAENGTVQVYVAMTRDQLASLPEYRG